MATFKLLSLAFNGPSWFSLPATSFYYWLQNAISQPLSPGQHEVLCAPLCMFFHQPWVPMPCLMALKSIMAINQCGISSNATSSMMSS